MGWAGGDDVRQVAVQCGRVEEARAGAVPVEGPLQVNISLACFTPRLAINLFENINIEGKCCVN